MASVLHVNARTTPRIRAELKAAKAQALRASKRFARLVQIALTLKFSCQANFTRAFHEATGQTPAQYRRGVGMIAAEPAAKNDNC